MKGTSRTHRLTLAFETPSSVAIVVASETIARKLSRAVERGQLANHGSKPFVVVAHHPAQVLQQIKTLEKKS